MYIVTEHVKTLDDWLSKERANHGLNQEAVSWGLCCIARGLHFINSDCKLVHGNLCLASIFISDCGDWKLGGFELVSEPGIYPTEIQRQERTHCIVQESTLFFSFSFSHTAVLDILPDAD